MNMCCWGRKEEGKPSQNRDYALNDQLKAGICFSSSTERGTFRVVFSHTAISITPPDLAIVSHSTGACLFV